MDNVNTYPNTFIRYCESDMIFHVDSNTTYLIMQKARSFVAGYCHLSDNPTIIKHSKLYGVILMEYTKLRHVVSSAAEVEVADFF